MANITQKQMLQGIGALLATSMTGGLGVGAGMLARSKFEERLKEDKDKTMGDKLLSKAPLVGGLIGAGVGIPYGMRKGRQLSNILDFAHHLSGIQSGKKSFYGTSGLTIDKIKEVLKDAKGFSFSGQFVDKIKESPMFKGLSDEDFAKALHSILTGGFNKKAALKKDVVLKEHQRRAVDRAEENGGSLLVAHATGSGKTLTGIAAFENLKNKGQARRAIVVVPAALRTNFIDSGVKKFTDSSHAVYGPKGEGSSLNIGDKSNKDYNIVSYELFREHGDQIIQDTGADTLIMDEIHKVRGTEGTTYNKIRELRPKFKNALTLTGSIVNNEPNEVVPLMDVTYGPTGHKLVSKKFFDNLFVNKETTVKGFINPKVYIDKKIKNKPQLSRYLAGKIDYVDHEEIEKELPKKKIETIEVPMTEQQNRLYQFSLSGVDPVTRWKIRNNIPVGQREASEAFGKLLQGRQLSTDHGFLDKNLKDKNPLDYAPKVQKVVADLETHLDSDKKNKSVIFGNLINNQVGSIEEALKKKKIAYSKFLGMGQEGMTSKSRDQHIKDFMKGDKRVLLISGAGSEGLDLKGVNLMQMLEGHFNPEKIHQAEARIRRLGANQEDVTIKRYVSKPKPGLFDKLLGGGDKGIDSWVYSIADRKEKLNNDFRDVLKKKASDMMGEAHMGQIASQFSNAAGNLVGALPGVILDSYLKRKVEPTVEAKLKQYLLDKGEEGLTKKMHYPKILAEAKVDEKILDASKGVELVAGTLAAFPILSMISPKANAITRRAGKIVAPAIDPLVKKLMPRIHELLSSKGMRELAYGGLATGVLSASLLPAAKTLAKTHVITNALSGGPVGRDLDKGIDKYKEKLLKKYERKYKGSKGFVQEYETKKDLGISLI